MVAIKSVYQEIRFEEKFLAASLDDLKNAFKYLESAEANLKGILEIDVNKEAPKRIVQIQRNGFVNASAKISSAVENIKKSVALEFTLSRLAEKIKGEAASLKDFQLESEEVQALDYIQSQSRALVATVDALGDAKNKCVEYSEASANVYIGSKAQNLIVVVHGAAVELSNFIEHLHKFKEIFDAVRKHSAELRLGTSAHSKKSLFNPLSWLN